MKYKELDTNLVVQQPGIIGMMKHIELCGRVCYHSENNITEDSYQKFVNMQIRDGHFSPLEHGSVYLRIPYSKLTDDLFEFFLHNNYSFLLPSDQKDFFYVTTNYRVIIENCFESLLQEFWYDFNKDEHLFAPRVTFNITCTIAAGKDFCRHRSLSPTQESTRYCNYSKDKFDNNVNYIDPVYWCNSGDETFWKEVLSKNEQSYFDALKFGYSTQIASELLNQETATTLILTGFISDWNHFIDLRFFEKTGKVRPECKIIAGQIYDKLNLFLGRD